MREGGRESTDGRREGGRLDGGKEGGAERNEVVGKGGWKQNSEEL